MKSKIEWKDVEEHKCSFCGKQMKYLCECGAYHVFVETTNLPLQKQPYWKEVKKNGNKINYTDI